MKAVGGATLKVSRCICRLLLLLVYTAMPVPDARLQSAAHSFNEQPRRLYKVYDKDRRPGFIDKTGKLVIGFERLPKATVAVGDFHEGLAVIYLKKDESETKGGTDNNVGYIDESGNVAVAPRYYFAHDFSEGLAYVEREGFHGFIDPQGREVVDVHDYLAADFHEGMAAVSVSTRKSSVPDIDRSGRLVIPTWPKDISGYIDRSGKLVIKLQYRFADNFSEGLAGVVTESGTYGFINQKGEMVIEPRFKPVRGYHGFAITGTSRFVEGLACVKEPNGLYGYINRKGEFVIKPQFERAQEFSEGLAWVVSQEGKIGWIDKSGRWIVTGVNGTIFSDDLGSIYSDETHDWRYSEGLVPFILYAGRSYLRGYMDKRGKVAIQPKGDEEYGKLYPFSDGVALVHFFVKTGSVVDEKYGYINRKGQFIWREQ